MKNMISFQGQKIILVKAKAKFYVKSNQLINK
jgi:hypothetical protein